MTKFINKDIHKLKTIFALLVISIFAVNLLACAKKNENSSKNVNPSNEPTKVVEPEPLRFIGSNIIGDAISKKVADSKKIVILFNDAIIDNAANNAVTIKKDNIEFKDFTQTLGNDNKSIVIEFSNPIEDSKTHEITIPSNITNARKEKLENPQTLVFSKIDEFTDALYIATDGDDEKDGSSWENAKKDLSKLLEASYSNGKTIFVAQGSYYADIERENITKFFRLKSDVKIYGGFDAKNELGIRNYTSSILEGKLSEEKNTKIILIGNTLSDATVLDGFVIQNGKKTGKNQKGAGLYLNNSNPQLNNLTFIGNSVIGEGSRGGAIYNESTKENPSHPSINNARFSKNTATDIGGAIYNNNSNIKISKSTFNNNNTEAGGGAIFSFIDKEIANRSITISNSSFIGNSSEVNGGAIYSNMTDLTLSETSFIGNSAKKWGGAMFSDICAHTITNATFSENSALDGGAMYNRTGLDFKNTYLLKINKSKFANNTASENGGAIYNTNYAYPILKDVSFTENKAEKFGGAIFNNGWSSPLIDKAIFTKNFAKASGGAIYNESTGGEYFSPEGIYYKIFPAISNSQFIKNSTDNNGGAIYNENSKLNLINLVFNGNYASYGGAIANAKETVAKISNATFTDNSATLGGAIYNLDSSPSISNSILWKNYEQNSVINNIYNDYTFVDTNSTNTSLPVIKNSILDINSAVKKTDGQDKQEVTSDYDLTANGSTNNKTDDPQFVDATNGDLKLTQNSTAIDSGDNTLYEEIYNAIAAGDKTGSEAPVKEEDLAGEQRFNNNTIDIGAYEFQN